VFAVVSFINAASSSCSVYYYISAVSYLIVYIADIKSRSSGRPGVQPSVPGEKTLQTNKSLTLLWGATGEQEWTPALTTGGFSSRV
jgi:hypothetical protein